MYDSKSVWVMTCTRGSFASSAIRTGLRLRIEILDTAAFLSMASSTEDPTSPVAPVRIRCILVIDVIDVREVKRETSYGRAMPIIYLFI